jgi:hypothetical protein
MSRPALSPMGTSVTTHGLRGKGGVIRLRPTLRRDKATPPNNSDQPRRVRDNAPYPQSQAQVFSASSLLTGLKFGRP